ncbi:sugar transferase [Legionella anisa]|nr:sugar transferase [Legionella anisa]MCW8423742.1 sugar transferase [Legionella anisa]MCW8447262.1 sugar transferase [Legionella anisa]UAK81289.1 sugar transferase [Legionella anisa]
MEVFLLKRIFDIVLASILLLILLPLICLIALLIRVFLGTPIFFRQQRPGLHGKIFQLIKFRTLQNLTDNKGEILPDACRITPFGKFLRATSLDELPELWNVIKGDMSLVGPRPLLIEYLSLYNERQKRRHEVKPGITGLTQIKGRNALAWEEKFELDIWYVTHHSLWLDIKILLLTIKKVLTQEGITSAAAVTADKFTGNKE